MSSNKKQKISAKYYCSICEQEEATFVQKSNVWKCTPICRSCDVKIYTYYMRLVNRAEQLREGLDSVPGSD